MLLHDVAIEAIAYELPPHCVTSAELEDQIAPSGLLTHGVALAKAAWQKAETELPGWSDSEIAQYAPHQVGSRHCAAFAQVLSLTPSKMFLNFMTLGNIGSAAVTVSLAQAVETGNVKEGDHVGLIGVGSGLNCSLMSVNW